MPLKRIPEGERRTIEQLREHYEIEKELANKIERKTIFTQPYTMSCIREFLITHNF